MQLKKMLPFIAAVAIRILKTIESRCLVENYIEIHSDKCKRTQD